MSNDAVLSSLLSLPQDESERAFAARYAPVLLFDARESFLPLAAGYTIFRQSGPSPSFLRVSPPLPASDQVAKRPGKETETDQSADTQ